MVLAVGDRPGVSRWHFSHVNLEVEMSPLVVHSSGVKFAGFRLGAVGNSPVRHGQLIVRFHDSWATRQTEARQEDFAVGQPC